MFDTVTGLPVHILVNHLAVIGIPLVAVVAALAALLRPRHRGLQVGVVVASALASVVAWVTAESGEALQERLGGQVALEHGEDGEKLLWFALALTVVSAVGAVLHRRELPSAVSWALRALVVVVAVATVVWVVLVGHSGAESVWSDVVSST